jgi:hypothetical protein
VVRPVSLIPPRGPRHTNTGEYFILHERAASSDVLRFPVTVHGGILILLRDPPRTAALEHFILSERAASSNVLRSGGACGDVDEGGVNGTGNFLHAHTS